MKLYNSLAREIKDFEPLQSGEISIYSCGPTVYERAHIGNLASFIYADTLKRALALAFPEAKIKHVMNLTDVDDKTIKRSQEEYPDLEPTEALQKLTRHYEDLFMKDLVAIGINTAQITFVRATDYILQMQELIKKLVAAGIGYVTDDGVYFSIAKYKAAGKKYGQLVDITAESTGAARVNNDEYDKDNVHDFALWKKQKPGEPAWDFEIDRHELKGRPGWHIECSAMSVRELGQPFDIHIGGVDLKFPHHENEIAQSTAIGDEALLARFFFHSEHMLVDGQKMSKSLNNFYTLEDIKNKGFDPLAFRLLVLQAHYRSQAHFSWENLEAAQSRLKRFINLATMRYQSKEPQVSSGNYDAGLLIKIPGLEDDIKTPEALVEIEKYIDRREKNGLEDDAQLIESLIKYLDTLFGLDLMGRLDIPDGQKQLITEREKAREAKGFAKSDELRAELEKQGIGLNDTPHGPIWFRL
jgi:cysteinyl-tRNA synthetase